MSNEEKPIEALVEEQESTEEPTEEDTKMEEAAKEEGEIDESTDKSMDVEESAEEKSEDVGEEVKKSEESESPAEDDSKDIGEPPAKDDSKDSDESESPAKEDDEVESPEKDNESNENDADKKEEDLEAFLSHWKKAVELESEEEIEKIYDDVITLVGQFSLEFLIENKLDDLIKQSMTIKKTKAGKEARKALQATYKLRKEEAKQAKAEAKLKEAEDKKRKRAEAKAAKSNKKVKSDDKKPRIKMEKVLEVADKMTAELAKNYEMGITEMTLDLLTTQVGYKNKRSDAIFESVKHLKREGLAEKLRGDICKLTEKGVKEYVKEVELPDNADALLEMYKKQFLTKLESMKNGSGNKVQTAASQVWDLLKDGKTHKMTSVLKLTGYGMERSTGIAEILKTLTKELEFAVKEKKTLRFTDKPFGNFGRPDE